MSTYELERVVENYIDLGEGGIKMRGWRERADERVPREPTGYPVGTTTGTRDTRGRIRAMPDM